MKNSITVLIWHIVCLLLFYLPVDVDAQDRSIVRIETVNNEIFFGNLVSEDEKKVVIQNETIGTITIERINIREIRTIDPARIRDGIYWFENPQSTRYFFTTNAIGMRKGQGYYQNTWIFFNNVNFGISDNISLGAGMVPMFLFGLGETPIWFLPKISIPIASEKFYLGAGAMVGGVIGEDSFGMGLLYGVSTIGNRDHNFSVGIGYGYAGNEWSSTPMINISGITRTGRSFYLLSENYFFPNTDIKGVLSGGIRWAPEKFALDFGLFQSLEAADIRFPWLGVTIPF